MSHSKTRRSKRARPVLSRQAGATPASDPSDILRERNIVVSFHYDIEARFERIHELVNRTDQLNFTKVRWKDSLEVARSEYFARPAQVQLNHVGYIKVRDRFGYYGTCGFFEVAGSFRLRHFLFSSDIMNMGVEQFVYQYLNFPAIREAGSASATGLSQSQQVDWITIVSDAEKGLGDSKKSDVTVCLRGSCELVQCAYYLRSSVSTVEEFHYERKGWNIRQPLLRNFLLADELRKHGISSCTDLGLPADFPAIDFAAFGSATSADNVDVCVWTFWLQPLISLYRHRATGLVMPLSIVKSDKVDMTALEFEWLNLNGKSNIERKHLEALRSSFEYIGVNEDVFGADLRKLRRKVARLGKLFVVVDLFDDLAKIDRQYYRRNRQTNLVVREALAGLPNVRHIAFSDCVADRSEELATNHFGQKPYMRLAERICALCETAGRASHRRQYRGKSLLTKKPGSTQRHHRSESERRPRSTNMAS